jgi:ABC-type dipeptide/oligopeptide/nickel transport system permease subunit
MSEALNLEVPAHAAPVSQRGFWRRLRLMPVLPLVLLGVFVVCGVAAGLLTPYNPTRNDLTQQLVPPAWVDGGSSAHLLGTDSLGRDVLARLLYGARVSLSVALFSLIIAMVISTVVGVTAGYLGGWIDSALMRLSDVVNTIPTILLALVLAAWIGPSFMMVVLVLGLLVWPRIARLIRGETLLIRRADFVRYSEAIGVKGWVVVLRHVLHNVLPTLLVAMTLEVGRVILLEASLSFLGAGIPSPQASWGVMIADGRALIATGWWVALVPGLAITIVVLSSNALGDWLRDRLDPKIRRE